MDQGFRFGILGDSRGRNTQINKDSFGKQLNNIKKFHGPDKLTEWNNFVKNIFSGYSLRGFLYPANGNCIDCFT